MKKLSCQTPAKLAIEGFSIIGDLKSVKSLEKYIEDENCLNEEVITALGNSKNIEASEILIT